MRAIGIIFFSLISIFTIDLLVGILEKGTRAGSHQKSAGIFGQLYFSLFSRHPMLINRRLSIKRFFLALISQLGLGLSIVLLLKKGFSSSKDMADILLSLVPLMAMPFYHFLFGILSNHPPALMATMSNFRHRGVLAIVISANIIFVYLAPFGLLGLFFHLLLAFIALVNCFFLVSCIRINHGPLNTMKEDFDVGPVTFMYYVAALLEFFYYSLLVYFVFIRDLAANWAPEQPLMMVVPLSIACLYLAIILFAKWFFINRSGLSTNLYESRILPLSFLFFGLNFLLHGII